MTSGARRVRADLLLVLAAFLWGMAFTAQRLGAERMGAFTFSGVRFAAGGALVALVALLLDLRRHTPRADRAAATRAVLLPGLVVGALLCLAVNLQQVGLASTTVANSAFITGLYLIWVPILGVFFGRTLRWPIAIAVVVAVVGLYLFLVTDTFTLHGGDALMLASALAFALEILAIDRFGARCDPLRFAAAQFLSCALFSLVLAPFLDAAPFRGIPATLLPLAYGSFISVGIAYTLQVVAQRDAEPAPAALIMALESVFGALGGVVLLSERLSARSWVGAGLMLAGILISQLGEFVHDRRARTAVPNRATARVVPAVEPPGDQEW